MWPFGKKTARQKEIRRSKAERQRTWSRQLGDTVQPQPVVLLLVSAAVAALIVSLGPDRLGLIEDQRIPRAITSRVAFRIEDQQRTEVERARARDSAAEYFRLDVSLLNDIRNRLSNALRVAREQANDPEKLRDAAAKIKVLLDDEGLEEMIRIAGLEDPTVYERAVERAVNSLRGDALVEPDELAPRRTGMNAILVDPEREQRRTVSIHRLLFANALDDVAQVAEAAASEFTIRLRPSMRSSLLEMFRADEQDVFRPLYRYDAAASEHAAQEAQEAVETQYVEYAVGSRLTEPRGLGTERPAGLTREELDLLRKEHAEFLSTRAAMPDVARAHQQAVLLRGLGTFLAVLGFGGYIILKLERRLGTTRPQLAAAGALLGLLGLSRLIYLHTPMPYLAVGNQALAVALLAIISGRYATQSAAALLALMITLAMRQNIGFTFVLLSVSAVLFLGLRDVRNRGRIIAVGMLAGLVALVSTTVVGLLEGQTLAFTFRHWAFWAALTTIAAAFIVEGILPAIERVFGVTTNMTLLEWCDPNKPLLRAMAAESPGTYNHSLLVGALADAAANSIGANGLLARAGAYYHDIGKMNKPEYFVENQGMDVGNRHERLSPAMSHLIIIGHVKDGIEMAKAYGVPSRLHAFIPEHHGTGLVEYFYHAANQARKPGDPEVSEAQFRYPGPKPQSRETAIVMMCDAVEGAVRAMPEPTPNRIEDTVERMVEKRLIDGQFDECDLTFRELTTIRASLVKSLISIYHGRIKYPTDKEKDRRDRDDRDKADDSEARRAS